MTVTFPVSKTYDFATTVLEVLRTSWPDPGDNPDAAPLPARQYVNAGTIAWDCEQVTVSVERAFPTGGDTGLENISGQNRLIELQAALIAITVLRCVPSLVDDDNGETAFPAAADIDDAAQVILCDRDIVYPTLLAAVRAGDLPGCSRIAFDGWVAENEQGGLGGGTTRIRALLL